MPLKVVFAYEHFCRDGTQWISAHEHLPDVYIAMHTPIVSIEVRL